MTPTFSRPLWSSLALLLSALGLPSCASMQQMQEKMNARMDQWKAEREEVRIKKELAKLQDLPDVPEDGSLFPDPSPAPAPIFLDYDNPERALARPSTRKKPSFVVSGGLPMDELPASVSEFTNTVAIETSSTDSLPGYQGTPVFREDVAPPTTSPALDTEIVSAWAQALAPIVPGAAVTAHPTTPASREVAPPREKAAILARLTAEQFNTAAAFAGRPSVTVVASEPARTSESEHQAEETTTAAAPAPEVTVP